MSYPMECPVVAGVEVTTDAEGRFNLNALHRASGLGDNKKPSQWIRRNSTKELIAELESQGVNLPLASHHGGENGGTFAHELLAISYAGWISPAFQLQVNQVFLDYRTGKLKPPEPSPDAVAIPKDEYIDLLKAKISNLEGSRESAAQASGRAEPPSRRDSMSDDPDAEPIADWLEETGTTETTTQEVWREALGNTGKLSIAESMRIAKILGELGFVRKTQRRRPDGSRPRIYARR